MLCIYQSHASCSSCRRPYSGCTIWVNRNTAADLPSMHDRSLCGSSVKYDFECQIVFIFSLCPWSWLWGETSTQMVMRMSDLKTAIILLGNLQRTLVGVLYVDIHTSTGIYLSNVLFPLSMSLKWTEIFKVQHKQGLWRLPLHILICIQYQRLMKTARILWPWVSMRMPSIESLMLVTRAGFDSRKA